MYGIFCTIEDITSSLYDIEPPFLWHLTHCIWQCIHCICVITSTSLMISHQMYLWASSSIYDSIIFIVYDITFTIFVTSQILYMCHNTHTFYVITPFVCMTSHPYLYNIKYTIKASHTHFMTSHRIIYDITCTVLMTSLPLYLTLHPLYLCHHTHSIYDLWPTVCMTSHPLYVWHLMHNRKCHIHSLSIHSILVITLHPLNFRHHTHSK